MINATARVPRIKSTKSIGVMRTPPPAGQGPRPSGHHRRQGRQSQHHPCVRAERLLSILVVHIRHHNVCHTPTPPACACALSFLPLLPVRAALPQRINQISGRVLALVVHPPTAGLVLVVGAGGGGGAGHGYNTDGGEPYPTATEISPSRNHIFVFQGRSVIPSSRPALSAASWSVPPGL